MIHPYDKKNEVLNTEKAKGYLLAMTKHNDLVELHLGEQGVVPSHALPIHVTFYVIEGKGTITIGDESIDASKGDVIEVKKDLERAWKNPSSEPLKLLVIKEKQ